MISRQTFLNVALASLAADGVPTPEQVELQIDSMLVHAPHLRDERRTLIDEALTHVVTSVGKAETMVDDEEVDRWIGPETGRDWVHWPWLKSYLATEVRRPLQVMKELEESTTEVIDLLGDPKREGIWDRRGLVVGHVQSGKTQHYTALAAKALDAGYKVIIILSGIHENLRQQTQERVEEVLIGKDSRNNFAHFGIRSWSNRRLARVRVPGDPGVPLPDIITLTSVAGDYGAIVNSHLHVTPGQAPVILVVKKNASILKNLLDWVQKANNQAALKVPTLVIDDEADHSSINTAATDPETNPTTINRLIRQILWRCDRVGFVGYTATPYANIFMDPEPVEKHAARNLDSTGSDIFPKSFITSLKSPTNYIGPEEVFGREPDESLNISGMAPLPMHRPAEDADAWLPPRHKRTQTVLPDLPPSLAEALRAFLLTVAARIALGQAREHMSMLVHVSRFTDVQEQVARHVENGVSALVERLRHGDAAAAEWAELRGIWTRVFAAEFPSFETHPSQQLVKPALPAWEDVRAQVFAAFDRMTFQSINSSTKENLDYAGTPAGLVVVAVGGDRLSRGLTLSGLSISYFLRGARAFDTLMQMGRWFGYRPGYAHLCRVYAPRVVVANFRRIALATEELRREFSRMCFLRKRPTEYGLRVREPRVDMLVTAMNKMRRGETVRVHFAESLASSLDIPHAAAPENHRAFVALVDRLESEHGIPAPASEMAGGEKGSYHHRWENVGSGAVTDFLKRYRATANVCFDGTADGSSMVARFIESMNRNGELGTWTVAIVGNSQKKNPAIAGRGYFTVNRNIDKGKSAARRNQHVFQGVAMGQDEAIDLNPEQYRKAVADAKLIGDGRSRAAFYRINRPSERGLLLLYPIIPVLNDQEIAVPESIIGVAVSFPSSDHDHGQDYVCNPRMMAELFGEQFAEDAERDEGGLPIGAILRARDRRPGLLVRFPTADLPRLPRPDSGRGFSFERPVQIGADTLGLPLLLGDPAVADLFALMGADLVSEVERPETEVPAVERVLRRIALWRRFLQRRADLMSDEEVRGLFGELHVLSLVMAADGADAALESWQGPARELHDFRFADGLVEVKSWRVESGARVQISQPSQIGVDPHRPMHLAAVQVSAGGPTGRTLRETVALLRARMSGLQVQRFEELLADYGYLEAQAEEYRDRMLVHGLDVYEVRAGFPHVDVRSIPGGVAELRYAIELGALEPFRSENPHLSPP